MGLSAAPWLLAACLFLVLVQILLSDRRSLVSTGCGIALQSRTLVVHVFADADPEYLENLRFFAQYGIGHGDNAEYIIIVQADTFDVVRLALPLLVYACAKRPMHNSCLETVLV